jgi:type VI secretion system protein ImpA
MASPAVLDFDRLLSPISSERPTGVALKDDPKGSQTYYAIRDAREAARVAERQQLVAALDENESNGAPPAPDWKRVKELSIAALSSDTKDLWLVAWLIEALVRLHGFAGARDGFRLARELVERYWDGIHPRPDDDGVTTTVAQLTGLNGDDAEGALLMPIANVPLLELDGVALTSAHYIDATDVEQTTDPDRRARRLEQGAFALQDFERAAAKTPVEALRNLHDDVEQSIEQFEALTRLLDERCGKGPDGYSLAPPSSSIRNALVECQDRVRSLAGPALDGDSQNETDSASATAGGSAGPSIESRVASREETLRMLLQVADYFRRTEPHSPVSYALEQAVRWGRMTLPELMTELISNDSARDDLFRLTGMRPVAQASD